MLRSWPVYVRSACHQSCYSIGQFTCGLCDVSDVALLLVQAKDVLGVEYVHKRSEHGARHRHVTGVKTLSKVPVRAARAKTGMTMIQMCIYYTPHHPFFTVCIPTGHWRVLGLCLCLCLGLGLCPGLLGLCLCLEPGLGLGLGLCPGLLGLCPGPGLGVCLCLGLEEYVTQQPVMDSSTRGDGMVCDVKKFEWNPVFFVV